MGWLIKGVVLLKGHPLSLGFPLWVVLLLEDTNWEVSQEELDLWWSWVLRSWPCTIIFFFFLSPFFLSISWSPDLVIPRSLDYCITWLLSWAPMCQHPIVSFSCITDLYFTLTRIDSYLLDLFWLLSDSYLTPMYYCSLSDLYSLLFSPLSHLVMVAAPKCI